MFCETDAVIKSIGPAPTKSSSSLCLLLLSLFLSSRLMARRASFVVGVVKFGASIGWWSAGGTCTANVQFMSSTRSQARMHRMNYGRHNRRRTRIRIFCCYFSLMSEEIKLCMLWAMSFVVLSGEQKCEWRKVVKIRPSDLNGLPPRCTVTHVITNKCSAIIIFLFFVSLLSRR